MAIRARFSPALGCLLVLLTACGGSGSGGGTETSNPSNRPTNVQASARTGENVITWPAISGPSSYTLYWSGAPGVSSTTGTPIPNVTSPYRHTGLTNGQTYYYVLTAHYASGESLASNEVSAMPDLGFNWTRRVASSGNPLLGVTYGGGQFVAVGPSGTIYLSSDGVQWTPQNINEPNFHLYDVAWTGSEYIAAGTLVSNSLGLTVYTPGFLYSSNGRTWSRRLPTWDSQFIANPDAAMRVVSLATSGNTFVAIMNGRIYYAVSSIEWHGAGQVGAARAAYTASRFFVVTEQDGRILSSSNGITWETRRTLGAGSSVNDIAGAGANHVAVGKGANWAHISASPDLVNWQSADWQSGDSTTLRRILWDGTRYISVGHRTTSGSTVDAALVSRNGLEWTDAYGDNTFHNFNAVASSGARLVAVGNDGAILSSP